MKKSFLSALMLILAIGANAQNPAEWEKGQEVTENLLWTDYRCENNENGGWRTKGGNVDLWTSPCFELYANNGTNEARKVPIPLSSQSRWPTLSAHLQTLVFGNALKSGGTPDVFKGKHDVYFYFPETRNAQFDEWRFTENLANGIEAIQIGKK